MLPIVKTPILSSPKTLFQTQCLSTNKFIGLFTCKYAWRTWWIFWTLVRVFTDGFWSISETSSFIILSVAIRKKNQYSFRTKHMFKIVSFVRKL